MTHMQVELPDQTVRDVQLMLDKRGEPANVAEFIDRTVQRALLFETVREIKRQNAGAPPDELDRIIDEAVNATRTDANDCYPQFTGRR